jgi:hypothetical protein
MTIPCKTCERPGSCMADRHCNRPKGLDPALREWDASIVAVSAATARMRLAAQWVQRELKELTK